MDKTYIAQIASCIQARIAWHEKAIAIQTGEAPHENGFDYPTASNSPYDLTAISEWRGAVRELKNTLHMLQHALK